MKINGNIIPEFNHLKNLIFLLITLAKVLLNSYLKFNKIQKGVNDGFIFLNIFLKQLLEKKIFKIDSP